VGTPCECHCSAMCPCMAWCHMAWWRPAQAGVCSSTLHVPVACQPQTSRLMQLTWCLGRGGSYGWQRALQGVSGVCCSMGLPVWLLLVAAC
jgi:hypothetical protein